jgi:hypothetical protein
MVRCPTFRRAAWREPSLTRWKSKPKTARCDAPNKPSPSRFGQADSSAATVVYVAVEGEVTEPDYLDYLNEAFGEDHGFRINIVWRRNGLKPLAAVKAVLARIDDGD